MSRRTVRSAAIVLLLAGGCARTSTNVRTYVASRPGLRLHYRLTDNGASTELTTIIAGESTFAGERVVPRTDWVDGKAMRARYLRVDATEAALVGDAGPAVGTNRFEPIVLLRGPVRVGTSWTRPGSSLLAGDVSPRERCRIERTDIEPPAGLPVPSACVRVACLLRADVQLSGRTRPLTRHTQSDLCPQVGIVRTDVEEDARLPGEPPRAGVNVWAGTTVLVSVESDAAPTRDAVRHP